MSTRQKYVIWIWRDEDGEPRFVGWGRHGRNHPAKQLWAKRNGAASDLNHWLRTFDAEPEREELGGIVRFYKHEAAAICSGLREKFENLLDPRPWGTKLGGGAARMVMSPKFAVFDSVRQAAVDEGVNPCTITRWCQAEGTGWDYLN